MAEDSFQEKTEQATPRRIKEAREKGQVAKSQEVNAVIVMLLGTAALLVLGPSMGRNMGEMITWTFNNAAHFNLTADNSTGFMMQISWIFIKTMWPIILTLTVVAFGISFIQSGGLFSTSALEPKFDKLNIVSGLKNVVSLKSAVVAVRDIIKLLVIGIVAYYAVRKEMPAFATYADMAPGGILSSMVSVTARVCFKILLALLIVAILDYAYQKFDYMKGLRMSRQDLKEEYKLTEGNPEIKGRIRAIQRQQSRKRMMQEVPSADVVVTNPTHIAVALKYDTDSMDAPTVIAKGERLIAEAIKKIAQEAGVPIVENKPLARALFKTVEIGMQVPADLYRAVAEVLAYVYSLKDKK